MISFWKRVLWWPLGFLYGVGVRMRNFCFDIGLLKSVSYPVPVVCVGNITVGGTGKTPHTEYVIAALQKRMRVACLSRGYGRVTRGFLLAGEASTAAEIGDEPLQIKRKFPDITVAVCESRRQGMERLLAMPEPPEVVVLDDAFQHRYVKAGWNVVMMDYARPVYADSLLPAGRLREPAVAALRRADCIIASKCPDALSEAEREAVRGRLKLKAGQSVYFTRQAYGEVRPLQADQPPFVPAKGVSLLCVVGIARPEPYVAYLGRFSERITVMRYPDHHRYAAKEVGEIEEVFRDIRNMNKYIFTTEKDAMRLRDAVLPADLADKVYYVPVEPRFMANEELFLQNLNSYVTGDKR